MPYKAIHVLTPEDYTTTLEGLAADRKHIILFYADREQATNKSWCPDCVNAEPFTFRAANTTGLEEIVEVAVGQREEWKDPANYYRSLPELSLTAVPTLVVWSKKDGYGDRLVEQECHDLKSIERLFSQAVL